MKKYNFIYIIVFLVLFSIYTKSVHASWWNDGWKYRKQLTFQNSAQTENLTNFPVLVKLTASNFDFSKAQSTGYDIRFLDTDGNTELPYEIEKWDATAQEAYVWVKVPQIDASSNSDYMYMYYGNSVAVNAQSTINVWNSNYVMVQHFNETTGTTTADSTSNYNNGTKLSVAEPNPVSTGLIDGALTFDGTNDYIQVTDNSTFDFPTNSFTLAGWFKSSTAGVRHQIFYKQLGVSNFYISVFIHSDNKLWIETRTSAGTYLGVQAGSYHDGQWHYFNAIRDDENNLLALYVDGALLISTPDTRSGTFNINSHLQIGRTSQNTLFFNGQLDEIRVSDNARSANWIAADYKSQNNTFISYNSEDTYVHSTANTQYVAQSSTEKPNCTNSAPAAPDLFQINTTKNTATLYFTPAGNPHNSYTISYGYDDNVERFGTGFSKMSSDGVQSYTINVLSPNTKYFFKIRASNGCMPGPWSRTMMVKTGYSNLGFIYYAYNSVVKMINSIVH